jgi:signal transduction histidine kinase
VILAGFSLCVFVLVGGAALADWNVIRPLLPQMVVWAALIAAADMLPVEFWGRVSFTLSLPVALAAGLSLPASAVGLLLVFATVDPREFRGELAWDRALFNRAQIALTVLVASAVFHAFDVPLQNWPLVVGPAAIAVALDCTINLLLMCVGAALTKSVGPLSVLDSWFRGVPAQYLLTWLALGSLALLMATADAAVGMWPTAAFLVPLALARQAFVQTQRVDEVERRLELKDDALLAATESVIEERRDERMMVAGELHDEVLPAIYKVHLMGQVLKQDLNSGNLLNLDSDLPELMSATELAQEVIRSQMTNLRESSVTSGGLRQALAQRAVELETAGSPRITLELGDVAISGFAENLLFLVGREAMNNAVRHSRASKITVRLAAESDEIRLAVVDDGVGFDPRLVDRGTHFGLQLMTERAKAAGGRVIVDSRLGTGTSVTVALPIRANSL